MAFPGFPARVKFTPVPNPFFSTLLEEIEDIEELKTTLRIVWLAYQKKGYPRYVTLRELLGDATLGKSLKAQGPELERILRKVLCQAVARGTVLHTALDEGVRGEELYLLNTDQNRKAVTSIKHKDISTQREAPLEPWHGPLEKPNIFVLYEQLTGTLTPLIVDELKEAEQTYPQAWIEEAFREAAAHSKYNWRYVARILERWAIEGKDDGESGRYSKPIDAKEYLRRYTPQPRP